MYAAIKRASFTSRFPKTPAIGEVWRKTRVLQKSVNIRRSPLAAEGEYSLYPELAPRAVRLLDPDSAALVADDLLVETELHAH
ncbi:Uncharacterised protein [Chlamydia trachomatis]|nr:Uncharacterised protein [Chlamydia trachomatis]CRH48752.1 Uncharacterised protein [Chlamydia trachomatis]